MKQIIIEVEDASYEPLMGMLAICQHVRVVHVSEPAEVLVQRDVCMKCAIDVLHHNGVLRYSYDYTWIMIAINSGGVDGFEAFKSPMAFLGYMRNIGVSDLPSKTLIYKAYAWAFNAYPHLTFRDSLDPSETLRRNNVIRQFLSAYGLAKRQKVEGIVEKR